MKKVEMPILENDRKSRPENEKIENVRHGKRQKMHTPENDGNIMPAK